MRDSVSEIDATLQYLVGHPETEGRFRYCSSQTFTNKPIFPHVMASNTKSNFLIHTEVAPLSELSHRTSWLPHSSSGRRLRAWKLACGKVVIVTLSCSHTIFISLGHIQ
jgi:hypothetical protein